MRVLAVLTEPWDLVKLRRQQRSITDFSIICLRIS